MVPTAHCSICLKDKSKHKMRLSPVEHPYSIILLSSIARYRIDMATASRLYEEWQHSRQHICIAHYVETILVLGRELRQLLGEFPVNGLADVPENIMDDFVAHIRMYGTLLGHGMCLEKKHVAQFYSENWSKYYKDVLKKVKKDKQNKEIQEYLGEDMRVFLSANYTLDQPSTSSTTADLISSSSDTAVVQPLPFAQFNAKPYASNEISSSALDLMGLFSSSMQNLELFFPSEDDSWRMTTCALCGVHCPEPKLRRPPEVREQHLVLLSGLVLANVIEVDLACQVYKDCLTARMHYCKHHFVQAALCFGDEARKACGQFPVRDFIIPLRVQAELLERIKQVAAKIDVTLELYTGDLVRFYTDCQARYYTEEGWRVLPMPEDSSKSLKKSKKRKGKTNVNQQCLESGLPDKRARISSYGLSSAKNRHFTCLICGIRSLKSESRVNSFSPDQSVILLCCMVMGYGLSLELAKIIFQEMNVKSKRTCRKHYIQAGIRICYEIQTIWGHLPPRNFGVLPCYIRLNLLARFRECAELINKEKGLTEDQLLRFYNDCQVRYRTDAGWIDADLWQYDQLENSRSHACARGQLPLWKRQGNDLPQFIHEQQLYENLSKEIGELSDEHLLALRRSKCCICGEIRLSKHTRIAKDDQALLLLCTLVLHDQISMGMAIELYNGCRLTVKQICHEHFAFVGEFLRAEYEKRYGVCTPNSLLLEPETPRDELFARLVDISKQISAEHCLERTSLSLFYASLQTIYCGEDEQLEEDEGESDGGQEIYLCNNSGVEEIPFSSGEAALKSELLRIYGFSSVNTLSTTGKQPPVNDERIAKQCKDEKEQSKAFTSTKKENSIANSVQDQSNLVVLSCSQEPSTSGKNIAQAFPRAQSNVSDEKSASCIELSAADLLGQNMLDVDDHTRTRNDNEEHYPFEEFVGSCSDDQEDKEISRSYVSSADGDPCSTESSVCFSANVTDLSNSGNWQTPGVSATNGLTGHGSGSFVSEEMKIINTLHTANPRKSIIDLAAELGISTATLLSYLRSKDTILSEPQLQCRLEICSALSLRNSREPFLSRILTYGEKVLFLENSKRLPHISVDAARGLPGKKILLTVWWSANDLICHQFVRGDFETMNADRFSRQVAEVHRRIVASNSDLAHGLGPIVLCDSPCPHITRGSTAKMYQLGFEILPYPSRAKDLLPSQYYFFPHLIKYMENKDYVNYLDMRKDFIDFISSRPPNFFYDGINELALRWKKCIESNGYYIDL